MKRFPVLIILLSAFLPSCSKAENIYVHPSFSITSDELDSTASELPEGISEIIKSDRKDFLDRLLPLLDIYEDFLVLADREHPLSENSIPSDLVELDSFSIRVNKKGMELRKPAFDALQKMKNDMEKEGLYMLVSSAYRSYAYQEKIYNYYISVYGQEETDKFSARPGTSQHQLGTAVDFGSVSEEYADTAEGMWMSENASKYGFSLSYPEGHENTTGYNFEPWHYRYITPEACIMQKLYFSDIQQYMLEYLHDYISFYRGRRIK